MPKILEIKETNRDMLFFLNNPMIDIDQKQKVMNSKIIVIPSTSNVNSDLMLYMQGTNEILSYMKSKLDDPNDITLLVEKGTGEVAAFSMLIIIGMFLVMNVAAPLFVNCLYDYLKSKAKKSKEELIFRVRLNIERKNKEHNSNIEIFFEGSADDFKEVIDKVKEISGE